MLCGNGGQQNTFVHNAGGGSGCNLAVGDIVLIKDEQKNRGLWNKGLVVKLIAKDGVVLGARLKTGENKIFERSVKQLYPLELKIDIDNTIEQGESNIHDNLHQT